MNSIECSKLSKKYNNNVVLRDISFSIEKEKITGLIGKNGAGKTTLLKLIAGYYKHDSGEIKVFGKSPFESLGIAQNLILIDDTMSYTPLYSITDIVEEARLFYKNFDKELAYKLIEYFNINMKSSYHSLSKGMKSSFNLILGISVHAEITLLDEPTNGMDISVRKDFYKAILKDYIAYPRTIIMSSHLLSEFEEILEEIILINDGEVILHMDTDDFKEYALEIYDISKSIEINDLDLEIIYREQIGKNGERIIIRNNLTELDKKKILSMNLEIKSVTSEELSIYLTKTSGGGISDVFRRG